MKIAYLCDKEVVRMEKTSLVSCSDEELHFH